MKLDSHPDPGNRTAYITKEAGVADDWSRARHESVLDDQADLCTAVARGVGRRAIQDAPRLTR